MLHGLIKSFHMTVRKRRQKGLRVSNFYWSFSNDVLAVKGLRYESDWLTYRTQYRRTVDVCVCLLNNPLLSLIFHSTFRQLAWKHHHHPNHRDLAKPCRRRESFRKSTSLRKDHICSPRLTELAGWRHSLLHTWWNGLLRRASWKWAALTQRLWVWLN